MDRRSYHDLKAKVVLLEIALSKGEAVSDQLENARTQLNGAPRGNNKTFLKLCGCSLLFLSAMALLYSGLGGMLVDMWRTPQHWYLREYRLASACVWNIMSTLSSTRWVLGVPPVLFFFLWLLQRRSLRWNAVVLMRTVGLFELLTLLYVLFSLFHLLLGPAGMRLY
jgi:hypothetical protein